MFIHIYVGLNICIYTHIHICLEYMHTAWIRLVQASGLFRIQKQEPEEDLLRFQVGTYFYVAWQFSYIGGSHFGGPYMGDPSILGPY